MIAKNIAKRLGDPLSIVMLTLVAVFISMMLIWGIDTVLVIGLALTLANLGIYLWASSGEDIDSFVTSRTVLVTYAVAVVIGFVGWLALSIMGIGLMLYPPDIVTKNGIVLLRFETNPSLFHVEDASCYHRCASSCNNYACWKDCVLMCEMGVVTEATVVKMLFPDLNYLCIVEEIVVIICTFLIAMSILIRKLEQYRF